MAKVTWRSVEQIWTVFKVVSCRTAANPGTTRCQRFYLTAQLQRSMGNRIIELKSQPGANIQVVVSNSWMSVSFILRKINLQTEYNRRHPRHACNSELYAEISESSNIKEKVIEISKFLFNCFNRLVLCYSDTRYFTKKKLRTYLL